MIWIITAALIALGTTAGWYAHRAYRRIHTWGLGLNAQDAIFRAASDEEIDGALRRIHVMRFEPKPQDSFAPEARLLK